jgi:RNA polymerase sigma-70 factor, ECF subfamily
VSGDSTSLPIGVEADLEDSIADLETVTSSSGRRTRFHSAPGATNPLELLGHAERVEIPYPGLYSGGLPSDERMWTPGDVEALYRETRFAVFLRCRSLLRDDAEARDVTQEVYLHLLAHPNEFRGESAPTTYLYAIATNRSLSRLRARWVRDDDWRACVAELLRSGRPVEDPEAVTSAREILSEALRTADEETTLMLVYAFVDGLPQGEVADLLGVSRVTVNQRIQKFRERVKQRIDEDGGASS